MAGGLYLTAESIKEIVGNDHSGKPAAGLAVAAAALLTMPVLAVWKHRTGQALNSRALIADADETALAAAAAATALAGVGLDTWLDWWWAVPAAGLVIAVLAFAEVGHIWRHRHG